MSSTDSVYNQTIQLALGQNTTTIIAEDASTQKNRDTLYATFIYDPTWGDTTGPDITLLSPQDGAITNDPSLKVTFKVTDPSGISQVTVNGSAVNSNDSIYIDTLNLSLGSNPVAIIAIDNATNQKNSDTLNATFTYDPTYTDTVGPDINFIFPSNGVYLKDSPVDVIVNVNDISDVAWVTINGQTAILSGGNYTQSINLSQGLFPIKVIAQDNSINENIDSSSITVTYDSIAPTLRLLDPAIDSSIIDSNSIKIEVVVKDNYGIKDVKFTFDGNSFVATASNDSVYFAAITDLHLNEFSEISVEAIDSADNSKSIDVAVKYYRNRMPTISIVGYTNGQDVNHNENETLTFTVAVNDSDGDEVTRLAIVNPPTPGGSGTLTYDTTNGSFTYQPDYSISSQTINTEFRDITFTAQDNGSPQLTATLILHITVMNINRKPVFETDKPMSFYPIDEGQLLEILFAANDADGDNVTYDWGSADLPHQNDVVFNTVEGKLSWQSNGVDQGNYVIIFSAHDNLDTTEANVNVSVGDVDFPPVVSDIPDQTIYEGQNFTTISLDAYVEDQDNNDDEISWTYSGQSPLTVTITNRVATITTPDADWNGQVTIRFTATDPTTLSDYDDATFTVAAVNDAPTFTKGSDQIVNEDAGAQTVNGWATDISEGPANESSQTVGFTVTNNNNSLFSGQPSIDDINGNLTYTPAANNYGSVIVTVVLKDDGGKLNGGVDSSKQTFTITVNSVNDAPSFTKGSNQNILEGAGAQSVSGWATNMSTGPTNESTQTLTFTADNNNTQLFSIQPEINSSNGNLTYTPETDAYGIATVTVTLKDNGGTDNGGVDSKIETFTINITGVNDEPSFTKGANQIKDEDAGAQSITGWATNINPGASNESGQTLTFSVLNDNNNLFSTSPEINASGNLTFTTAADSNGSATVTVTLSDNGGTANGGDDTSPEQTFTITVNAVPDAPVWTTISDINTTYPSTEILSSNYADDADGDVLTYGYTFNGNSIAFVSKFYETTGRATIQSTDIGSCSIRFSATDGVHTEWSNEVIITFQ